jgi:hypothetical protein
VGGINHYQYAPNHVNWVDPFGLSCKENSWNEFQKDHKGQFKTSQKAALAYQDLIKQQSPWPIGFIPIAVTILPGGEFNMAYEPGQNIEWIGGFGTEDEITSKSYVRNDLAVKVAWKSDLDRVVKFKVVKPLPAFIGPVGPQIDEKSGKYLKGGGSQIAMDVPGRKRSEYLDIVSVTELKK